MTSRLHRVASCAVFGASLVSLLGAQGAVGPTQLGPSFRPAGLNPPQVPAASVLQVQLQRLPGDPPGTWTAAMTVTGLAAGWGGQGGQDLLIGQYDARADTFRPSLLAAACNTPGREFGAMLDADGLEMVFERDGWVQRASRPFVNQQFNAGQVVDSLPFQPYYDPALGTVGGQRMLFYAMDGTVRRSLFDQATGKVIGPSIVVVGPTRPGGVPNSPTPIVDAAGETTGLLHHELSGAGNDQYLAVDLDPDSPSHLVLDTPSFLNNGGAAGGLIVTADSANGYGVTATPAAWMTGAETTIGRSMRVSMLVPPAAAGGALSFLMLGMLHAPAPLPIPGIQGALGLDPATFITYFPIGFNAPGTGEAGSTVTVPNDPSLMGLSLPVQGATQIGAGLVFTNTSSLRVAGRLPSRNLPLAYDGGQTTLVAPIDPEDPSLTVTLPTSAPLPIEIVALDLVGLPVGEAVTLLPGSVASLAQSTAAAYVARTPFLAAAGTTLLLQDGKAAGVCKPHKRDPDCTRNGRWTEQELPKAGVLCIEIQPQVNGHDTQCNPVEWELWSEVGGAPLRDQNGSVDSRTDISEQVCSTPRAGGTSRKLKFRCSGSTGKCRVTIAVTEVKDCDACPAGKNLRR
jgi:hypothetical protein